MSTTNIDDVTQYLLDGSRGDREALDKLMPAVYRELQKIAHRYLLSERRGNTLIRSLDFAAL